METPLVQDDGIYLMARTLHNATSDLKRMRTPWSNNLRNLL
jgi:hypothetical protein